MKGRNFPEPARLLHVDEAAHSDVGDGVGEADHQEHGADHGTLHTHHVGVVEDEEHSRHGEGQVVRGIACGIGQVVAQRERLLGVPRHGGGAGGGHDHASVSRMVSTMAAMALVAGMRLVLITRS